MLRGEDTAEEMEARPELARYISDFIRLRVPGAYTIWKFPTKSPRWRAAIEAITFKWELAAQRNGNSTTHLLQALTTKR